MYKLDDVALSICSSKAEFDANQPAMVLVPIYVCLVQLQYSIDLLIGPDLGRLPALERANIKSGK